MHIGRIILYRVFSARYSLFVLMCPKIHINQWLVGCFGFNGPLRQYFSLYRAVSQREGDRGWLVVLGLMAL